MVCGFAGLPTGCCPTSHPYYCQSTQSCYPTANAASQDCGSDCEHCLAIGSTQGTSSAAATSSSSGGGDCNAGIPYSNPPQAGTCPTAMACTMPPFSCISAQGVQDDRACCCDPEGIVCIGCLPSETCSGQLGDSPVSCCPGTGDAGM